MNILGLDASSQKSGYALFVDGALEDYGVWELTSDEEYDWRKRIGFMADNISAYCERHDVDIIYAEDVPPISQNSQTVKVLSALQGMLIALSVLHCVEIYFVPVKRWKQKIGINLVASKENNDCKKRIKHHFGKDATKPLNKVKGWAKAYEKKLSVDYVNDLFDLELVYKSPTSKYNQDDIADAINIAWSEIGDVKPYDLRAFKDITDEFYDLVTT